VLSVLCSGFSIAPMGEGVRDREVIEPTFGKLGGHSIHYV
jgi:hypothetical protein